LNLTNGWLKTELAGSVIDADGIACQLALTHDDPNRPDAFHFNLTADALQYGELAAAQLQLAATKTADGFELQGSAQGEHWQLNQLTGTLSQIRANDGTPPAFEIPDLKLVLSSDEFKAGKTTFNLQDIETLATIKLWHDEAGAKTDIRLTATSEGLTLHSDQTDHPVSVNGMRLAADARLNTKGLETAVATLTLDQIEHALGMSDLSATIDNTVLTAEFSPDDEAGPAINTTLSADSVNLLDANHGALLSVTKEVLTPITGTYNLTQRVGLIQCDWPLQPGAVFTANGVLDLSGKQPAGSLSFACDGFRISEEQEAVKQFATSHGLAGSGDLSLTGQLQLTPAGLAPRITIATKNADLSSTRYQLQAEVINGSITFTGLSPVATPGNQLIEFRQLKMGKLLMEDGVIALRLEDDPAAILIERAEWGCLGGRVYSRALRIDQSHPEMDIRLFADGLDVGKLFGMAFGEDGNGSGSLYGMIPVTASRTHPSDFSIGEGFLYSTTEEGSWKLSDSASATAVQRALEQQLERALQGTVNQDVHDKIFSALRDFEYTLFKIDLIRRPDGLLARVTAQGRSRNQKVPVEFEEIVLDLPGFEKNMREIMMIKTAFGQGIKQATESPN
jgi:hypothetical protein